MLLSQKAFLQASKVFQNLARISMYPISWFQYRYNELTKSENSRLMLALKAALPFLVIPITIPFTFSIGAAAIILAGVVTVFALIGTGATDLIKGAYNSLKEWKNKKNSNYVSVESASADEFRQPSPRSSTGDILGKTGFDAPGLRHRSVVGQYSEEDQAATQYGDYYSGQEQVQDQSQEQVQDQVQAQRPTLPPRQG